MSVFACLHLVLLCRYYCEKKEKENCVQAMSAAFLNLLNESEKKLFTREEQMQREWENEAELQHWK